MKKPHVSRPLKILLHMARVGDEWKGKATHFESQNEFKFSSLTDLSDKLIAITNRRCHLASDGTQDNYKEEEGETT